MKKYGKRIAAAGLCAALAMTSLTGCGAKASDVVATMDGTELTLGEATFLLRYNQAQTQSYLGSLFGEDTNLFEQDLTGSGETYGETLKSNILSTLKELVMLEQHMSDYGVEITEEDTAAIEEATQEFLAANSDDVLKEMMATEDTVSRMLTLYTIQARMEVAIEADADTEVSDSEAAEKTIQYAYFSIPETEEETDTEAAEEETGTETEAASDETEAVSETESESAEETEAVSETETEAVSETESESAEETEAVSETETEAVSETESESTEETEAVSETETEAISETESESTEETEAVSETETEAAVTDETGTEGESDTETADETESETETETEESAEKKETREQAQSVIDAVLAGETLEDAVAAVDEDKTVTDYSYGSDDETLVEVLKTAADTLSDGEIYAEPVETDNGFYVVQMVTTFDEEATEEHKLEIIEDRKDELYDTVLGGWEPESFEINDDVWDEVDFTDILTLMTEAETETDTEATTDTETTSETGTEETSETETASETDTEEATEAETASETDTEEATEAESASEADTEEATETESASETDTE